MTPQRTTKHSAAITQAKRLEQAKAKAQEQQAMQVIHNTATVRAFG